MPVGLGLGISAAAGLAGSVINAGAASSAAKSQANAADQAAQMQLGEFNTINSQLAPYRDVGTSALPTYSNLLGLGGQGGDFNAYVQNYPDLAAAYQAYQAGGGTMTQGQWGQQQYQNNGQGEGRTVPGMAANQAGIESTLSNLPGYQFTKQQGTQAVTNQMAAAGLGGTSGAYAKGLARYVTGLADNTYQQQLGNYQGAVGIGGGAATQTGTFGTNATNSAAGSLVGGANAGAAGQISSASSLASGLGGAGNAFLQSQLLGMYGPGGTASGANLYGNGYTNGSDPWAAGPQI